MFYNKLWRLSMKILITTGPTWEFIDPVRIITSPSTGTIGLLLTREFLKSKNNKVTLICGHVLAQDSRFKIKDSRCILKRIVTAQDMFSVVKKEYKKFDVIIMAASVSDFRAKKRYVYKLKKKDRENLTIELVQNPDILSFLSDNKTRKQILVGFSLENQDLLKNTLQKFSSKKVDLIVANKLPAFGNRKVNGYFIYDGEIEKFENYTKSRLAQKIVNIVYKLRMILRLNF